MERTDPFKTEILRLEQLTKCTIGLSAIHLPTLRSIGYRVNRHFLLCSTYKIPIAVCLLKKVERKELTLEHLYTILESDLRSGMISTLNQLQYSTPVTMSVLNLLQFMLQESCNTASDIVLRLIGGPKAVMLFLQEISVNDLRVDRFTLEIMADSDGIDINDLSQDYTLEKYKLLENKISLENKKIAREKFKTDVRDKGTPDAMSKLLILIKTNKVLAQDHSTLLLKIMQRCKTGPQRIMGLLPMGLRVSHKTGTATGYTNDVGIVYLPENQGEIALSVYVEHFEQSANVAERLIAEATRNVIDYFLFQP